MQGIRISFTLAICIVGTILQSSAYAAMIITDVNDRKIDIGIGAYTLTDSDFFNGSIFASGPSFDDSISGHADSTDSSGSVSASGVSSQISAYTVTSISAIGSVSADISGSGVIGSSSVDSLSLFSISFDLLSPHVYEATFGINSEELSGVVDIFALSFLDDENTSMTIAGFDENPPLSGNNIIADSGVLPAGSYRIYAAAEAFVNDLGESATAEYSVSFSVSAVPIPSAIWLFGSGLLGLVGIARRKRAV